MKFLNDIVLTGAGADLTAPATVTFSGLSATTETSAVVVNSSGVLSKRTLGSNAFNSTTIPTNAVLTTGNQTIAGVKTFTGDLTISQTDATAPGVMLNLHNVSNGIGTTIRCTDVGAGTSQFGDITYRHQDSKSYGSAAMFELGSTEATTTILANGKLMYKEGIYSKPASGTAAGTRKDANWDTAYTHSQVAHAPANAEQNVQADWGETSGDAYIKNKPTIPSGNQIIDWTSDQGSTNIHAGNYTDTNTQNSAATTRGFFSGSGINTSTGVITNTTYGSATVEARGLIQVGDGLSVTAQGVLSVADASESTSGKMTAADKTKLNAIEPSADVTDATNVAAAGASMKTSTETISGTKTFSALTTISNTTDSSSASGANGALRTGGGASVAKKLYVGSTITGSADVIAYSDKRLKKNIKTLDGKKVLEMRGVSFERSDSGKQSSGVIAQEMEKVAPELVIDDGSYKGVAYGNVVGYLIEAIKDQQKQIDELKAIVDGNSK